MEATKPVLTVETIIHASAKKVWDYWTQPEHVMQWNNAADTWHTPKASNDLQVGGSFSFTMAAKDGSMSFDFGGVYTAVTPNQLIAYTLGDGRKVEVHFTNNGDTVTITENFEAENLNPLELQQSGWQAILNNFKRYTEKN